MFNGNLMQMQGFPLYLVAFQNNYPLLIKSNKSFEIQHLNKSCGYILKSILVAPLAS